MEPGAAHLADRRSSFGTKVNKLLLYPGIGGRLPTYLFMTRNSAMIAARLVVMQ